MAGEETKKFGAEPNFKWPPERYYNLAAYVLMFNGIANDHDEYGIENSNGDQVINQYIQTHLEELVTMQSGIYNVIPIPKGMPTPPLTPAKKPGVSDAEYAQLLIDGGHQAKIDQYKRDLAAWENATDFVPDPSKSASANDKAKQKIIQDRKAERDKYKKKIKELSNDLPNLIAKAKEYCRKANYDGKYLQNMLTNEQMGEILREKYEGVRSWHEDCRKHVKGKSGKKDKDGQFDQWHDWDNAQAELRNKNKIVRRNGWRTFRRLAATALFGGVALASVSALLAYGGFALTAMFGTAFNATGVSGAVLGFIGTVAGGTFAKRFFGRFLDSWNEGRKLRRDRREYIKSFGKYSDKIEPGKTRQARGYRNIRQRYYESMAIMTFLEKGKLDTTVKKGLKGEELKKAKARAKLNKKLQVYLDRGLKRGTIMNPYGDGGMPLDLAQLEKESRFYRFVTDGSEKHPYGFDHILAKLGAAKSMNVNDVHSVQAQTVISEDFLRSAERGGQSLADVKVKLEELKRGESKFEGDNKDKYQELLYRFSDVVMDTMDRELFDNVFDSGELTTLNDIFKSPEIKERYEKTRVGDCSEKADNAFEFISNISNDNFIGGSSGEQIKMIDGTVEASIVDQLNIKATNMQNACSRYNIPAEVPNPAFPPTSGVMMPNPDIPRIDTVIRNIEAIRFRKDAADAAVSAEIDDIENTKARNYLKYMYDKKLAETRYDKSAIDSKAPIIPDPVRTIIANIDSSTSQKQIASIKQTIMTGPDMAGIADPDDRKRAIDLALSLVQDQLTAVGRKERTEATLEALVSIRENSYEAYKKQIDELPNKSEDINIEDLLKKLSSFKKIDDKRMARFLVCRLKDKVTSILKREITSDKYDVKENEELSVTIDKLRLFMRRINLCEENGIIDTYQTSVIIKAAEQKIIGAFTPFMRDFERDFLKNGAQATSEKAVRYLDNVQGFGHFLNSGNAVATSLKRELTRVKDAKILEGLLTASGKGAFQGIEDFDKEETKTTLRIYFMKDRDASDPLLQFLTEMKAATDSTEVDPLKPEQITAMSDTEDRILGTGTIGSLDTSKSFVYKMSNLLSTMDADLGVDNHADKIAALLTMKKRVLAMLKVQMNALYESKKGTYGDNIGQFIRGEGSAMSRAILKKWEGIARDIDAKITAETRYVSSDFGASAVGNLYESVEKGSSVQKYSDYMYSPNM